MKIFITGATGFIGSYLTKSLLNEGNTILCLKRNLSDLSKVEDIVEKVTWINIEDDWKEVVRKFKPDAIFHLAWNGVSSKERILWRTQISNIEMLQELLDLALECGTNKIISTGSQSEYGDFENKITESYPEKPKTAYAAVKVASKVILQSFCEMNNMDWFWFRIFPVFGPYENLNWLIPSLIKCICTTDSMDLTFGEQKLAYLYVGECANAIASAVKNNCKSGVYNVCADNPIPLKELVTRIRNKINPEFKLNFGALPYRYGQCMYMEGDTTSLMKNIYKINTLDFDSRLDETIKFYIQLFANEK
jgi:UDP-glucose 4-epimerase